jgi:hypothetical protein
MQLPNIKSRAINNELKDKSEEFHGQQNTVLVFGSQKLVLE